LDGIQLKVLHFGRFYSSYFGGLERHVELLLTGLGRHITVDNIVSNDKFRSEIQSVNGYKVYKVASFGVMSSMAITPAMPFWVKTLFKEKRYDIMHLHFPDPLSHFSVGFLPKSVKLVITWHSDIVRQKKWVALYRPFLDSIVRRADAIIAATPKHFSTSTQLSACENSKKLHVIPYGIDLEKYALTPEMSEAAARIRARHQGKKLIFSVGRHVYYKGYEYLLRAMQEVDALLLLGGTGPLANQLIQLASSLKLEDRVIFTGRITDEELPAYYHACDLYCMPSVERSEAFGIVQIEAMACKKPVVCCELNNGVTYVNLHGLTGLAVPPRDPGALARALGELMSDDDKRKSMGEYGYARVCEEFTAEKMCRDTLRLYERLLDRNTA
jgi:rhamnosyl/mannosyltransferase